MNQKEVKKLKDDLCCKSENGFDSLSDKELDKVEAYSRDYIAFLKDAKTERETVDEAVAIAEKAGFIPFDRSKKLKAGDRVYQVNRGKAVILAVIGTRPITDGVSFAIAHIDSPRLDLKPNPLYEKNGLAYFDTHYYGGIKKYQWTSIPLELHGVIVKKNGETVKIGRKKGEITPVMCVTDLLPHLADEQMKRPSSQVVRGEDLDILIGSRPLRDAEGDDRVKLNIMKFLNEKYGIVESDFLSAELEAVPAFDPTYVGFDGSLIGGYGHDDRVCAYPALTALLAQKKPAFTAVTVLTDKEEIGSEGSTGMQSAYVRYFIDDLAAMFGAEGRHVLSRSLCLSADVNVAYDPLYPEPTEITNCAQINHGVTLTKYTGARGKSGTSDASAEVMGKLRREMDENGVLWQIGELGKVDAGGGGTIAMYIANLDVDTVDLGVPVLSMHAPFEVISCIDVYMAHKAFSALLGRKD